MMVQQRKKMMAPNECLSHSHVSGWNHQQQQACMGDMKAPPSIYTPSARAGGGFNYHYHLNVNSRSVPSRAVCTLSFMCGLYSGGEENMMLTASELSST